MTVSGRVLTSGGLKLKLQYLRTKPVYLTKTNANDTLEAVANVTGRAGVVNVTSSGDTLSSNILAIGGAILSKTEANDTFSIIADVENTANVSISLDADTLSSRISIFGLRVGESTYTESDDTLSSSQDIQVIANATISEQINTSTIGTTVLIEGEDGSDPGDNAPIYARGTNVTPPDNCLMLLVCTYIQPNGHFTSNLQIYDDSTASPSLSYELVTTIDNNHTTDRLRTFIYKCEIGESPGTFKLTWGSDAILGPSVWKIMYVQNYNETTPIRQIVNATGEAATSTPFNLTFSEASYTNSQIVAITAVHSNGGFVDSDPAGAGWTVPREFTRSSGIPETTAGTYLNLSNNVGGFANVNWGNIEGDVLGYTIIALELNPEITIGPTFGADTLEGFASSNTLLNRDFQDISLGTWTENTAVATFNNNVAFSTATVGLDEGRTNVIVDSTNTVNKALRVTFDPNERGITRFQANLGNTAGGEKYTDVLLEYRVRFADNFDFRRGGKLPGLAGGSAPLEDGSGNTGLGFSAMFHWIEYSLGSPNTSLSLYVHDMTSDNTHLRLSYTDPVRNRTNTTPTSQIVLQANTWYTLKQRLIVNSPGANDGSYYCWVNGNLALQMTDCQFSANANYGIDKFYFATNFGGSDTADWWPTKQENIDFDNFRVVFSASANVFANSVTLAENFQSADLGEWTPANSNFHFTEDAGLFTRAVGEPGRFTIIQDPSNTANKILQVKYDAFTRGSNTAKPGDTDGSDIIVWHSGIDSAFNTYKELQLEYKVKFGNSSYGFDFGRGGKLPGLACSSNIASTAAGYASGGDPNSYARNGTGSSMRHMWLEYSSSSPNTIMDCFLADMDIPGSSEEHVRFNTLYPTRLRADATTWNPYSASANSIQEDTWYTVTQYIKMNTVEANGFVNDDGVLREYLNGVLALEMTDCRFISNNNWGANLFVFSTFFGGNSDPAAGYITQRDEYTYFDDFTITVFDS